MPSTISLNKAKSLINYAIDNNIKLSEEGKTPIALSLEASAGIGKTSVIRQIATDRNMTLIKLNMSQLEEPGDLVGYPVVEFECQVGQKYKTEDGTVKVKLLDKTAWLTAKQLENNNTGLSYRQTGKKRMSYAKPAWVPEYNENGTILLLDDYVRSTPQLLQACMDLILEQKYISWSLPKKTTICLTNNPDDGSNNVNSLDEAQRSRFLNFDVAWDMDAWSRWAEEEGVDGRCINFVLSYSNELFGADEDGNRICNPRSYVMFANMISGVKNWDSPESLDFIGTIAKGCFKDEEGRFSRMFTTFIRNKMHLLITPKELLNGKWDELQPLLMDTLYDSDGKYRPDVASILERRFSNYVLAWLKNDEKTPIKKVESRILDFMHAAQNTGKAFFSADMVFHMLKTITSEKKGQTNHLLYNPEIMQILA